MFTEFLMVLKDPPELSITAYGFCSNLLVAILILAPKAPLPLEDVPTPRCTCILSIEVEKSGILTQKTPCDSPSFNGIPSTVTLVLVGSTPRILNPVYPTPAPASEVTTVEGIDSNK